jgi:hypothetical protein
MKPATVCTGRLIGLGRILLMDRLVDHHERLYTDVDYKWASTLEARSLCESAITALRIEDILRPASWTISGIGSL